MPVDHPPNELEPIVQRILGAQRSRKRGTLVLVALLVVAFAAAVYVWLNYDGIVQTVSSAAQPATAQPVASHRETVPLEDFQTFQKQTADFANIREREFGRPKGRSAAPLGTSVRLGGKARRDAKYSVDSAASTNRSRAVACSRRTEEAISAKSGPNLRRRCTSAAQSNRRPLDAAGAVSRRLAPMGRREPASVPRCSSVTWRRRRNIGNGALEGIQLLGQRCDHLG